MQSAVRQARSKRTQKDLTLLLLASVSFVLVIVLSLTPGGAAVAAASALDRSLVAAAMAAAAALATALVWRSASALQGQAERARREAEALRRALVTADSILKAEPHVLVFWERGEPARVVANTLRDVPGVPVEANLLLTYGDWLEAASAESFRHALDQLFEVGQPFNMILRTQAGGHLEADGRTAGGRAVVRMRDVAGYRRDLARIQDTHQALARDIGAMRELVDALPNPVWLKDRQGRITWVNKAYARAVEASGEGEVLGRQMELLETRQRRVIEQAAQRGESFHGRVRIDTSSGSREHEVIAATRDGATAAAAIDVDALERARSDLDRLSAAYDRTLDRVGTAVAIFDRSQRLTFHNKAYGELWRLDADWLGTNPTDGAILDRLRDLGRLPEVVKYREWKTKVLASYATGSEREDWWHLPDGRIIHVMTVVRPDGGVTYLYADETERLALETSYKALTRVQGETLDSLKEGVAVFATDGRLTLANAALGQIWKLSPASLAESPHIEVFIRQAAPLFAEQKVWSQIARAVTAISHERQAIEGQMVRADNSVVQYAATPLPDGGTLLTFADVTDAKRYERALVERNEALVTADRLKNRFIGHVSYELRTPLTNIIGFSELLAAPHFGTLNGKQREYLSDITASSQTLLAIIDDILDLATFDAGALELKLGAVDVRGVIDRAVAGVAERARRDGIILDIGIADDAKRFTGDESRVRQILYNLLSNAIGFSKPGSTVWLAAWHESSMANDGSGTRDWIVFAVQDQGVGIPPEQQARVFERFESRTLGSGHRGAGLGLSIVKGLVELHGGEVELLSQPGQGTRVTVWLPLEGHAAATGGGVAGAGPALLTKAAG